MAFIVKNTTVVKVFGLLAPHSCRGCGRVGWILCNRCKKYIISEHKQHLPNEKLPFPIYVADERESIIGELIYDLKFSSCREAAASLGEIIDAVIPEIDGRAIVVPLPTINRHVRERGLDHTLRIAKVLAKRRGNFELQKVLLRNDDTVQVGSDRQKRLRQAEKAYKINPKVMVNSETTYVVFDDIWTTGASIKAAIKILQKAGVRKIVVAVLAISRIEN